MSLHMPEPDQAVLARRGEIAAALRAIVADGVIDDAVSLKAYESDGLTAYRQHRRLAIGGQAIGFIDPQGIEVVDHPVRHDPAQGVADLAPAGENPLIGLGHLQRHRAYLAGREARRPEADYFWAAWVT